MGRLRGASTGKSFSIPFFLIASLLAGLRVPASADVLATRAYELEYTYQTSFRSLYKLSEREKVNVRDEAKFHAVHLTGLFMASEYAEDRGQRIELIEGYAAIKNPRITWAKLYRKKGDDYLWVKYTVVGTVLVLKDIADQWMGQKLVGTFTIPLLRDLPAVYKDYNLKEYTNDKFRDCTNPEHPEPYDFSYFYNPYFCDELFERPYAKPVTFKVRRKPVRKKLRAAEMPLQEITGDNGNGKLTVVYVAHGYDIPPKPGATLEQISKDPSYKLYQSLRKNLVEQFGFTEVTSMQQLQGELGQDADKLEISTPVSEQSVAKRRFYRTYVRKDADTTWVIRSSLSVANYKKGSDKLHSFPKFWQEAWLNGDAVFYGGHAADGEGLSTEQINRYLGDTKYGEMVFKNDKTQLVFFDSCTSYGHYQNDYFARKPDSLYMVTFGLVSPFFLAHVNEAVFMETLLKRSNENVRWLDFLHSVEKRHLAPMMKFNHIGDSAAQLIEEFRKGKNYPNLMLNVRIPVEYRPQ